MTDAHVPQKFLSPRTKRKKEMPTEKKILLSVIAVATAVVLVGGATTAAIVLTRKKKQATTTQQQQQQTTGTKKETETTTPVSTDIPEMKQIAIKSGTYLSMWNSMLSCSTTKVGDSETFDLLKSATVSGAYVIQNKQGRYLSCSTDGTLSVSAVAGPSESWFVKNINTTGLVQSYNGFYLSKAALSSTAAKATTGTGDYFTMVYVSSIKEEPAVVPTPTSSKIFTASISAEYGTKYMRITSAGWVTCNSDTAGMEERFYAIPVPSAAAVAGNYICTMDGRYLVGDANGKLSMSTTQTDWGVWSIGNFGNEVGGQIYSVKGRYDLVCDSDGSVRTTQVAFGDTAHSTFRTKIIST